MTRMPFASKPARVVIGLLIVAAAFVWWIDRSRVHEHGGPPEPRDHANAARSALWEIRTAQEVYAARELVEQRALGLAVEVGEVPDRQRDRGGWVDQLHRLAVRTEITHAEQVVETVGRLTLTDQC